MTHVVINLAELENWLGPQGQVIGCDRVVMPSHVRPTVIQRDRETAEVEAQRLAREHPDGRFVVFAPVSEGVTVNVPTHRTLAGKVFKTAPVVRLVAIAPEDIADELPF